MAIKSKKGKRMNILKKLLLTSLLTTATLFASFQTVDCSNQTHLETLKLPQVDCEALEAFWDATGQGAGWISEQNASVQWDRLVSAEDWYGITLWPEGGIKWFNVAHNNITGEIPAVLGNFTSIEILAISYNNLSGRLPQSMGSLITAKGIFFENNNFHGPLPDFTEIHDLAYLYIDNNAFTFSDIEPQVERFITFDTFADHPQAPIDESKHKVVYFNENIPLVITPTLAENPSGNDKYIWMHRSTATEQDHQVDYNTSRIYIKLHPLKEDAGYYSYIVENDAVTYISDKSEQRLMLISTRGAKAIHAVYNHAPEVSPPPSDKLSVEAESSYSYTLEASDADQDTLSFSIVSKPVWLNFDESVGELSGTPTQSNIGEYNISLAVSDGKQITDINYTLKVLPKDLEPQTPVAPVNNSYKHSVTGNTIATALTNPQLHLYFDGTQERAMFIENNECSTSTYHAYIGFPYSGGQLYTGYLKCGVAQVLKSTIENNTYPNGSTATLLNEPNTNKPMIMVEIPLTEPVTIGE